MADYMKDLIEGDENTARYRDRIWELLGLPATTEIDTEKRIQQIDAVRELAYTLSLIDLIDAGKGVTVAEIRDELLTVAAVKAYRLEVGLIALRAARVARKI